MKNMVCSRPWNFVKGKTILFVFLAVLALVGSLPRLLPAADLVILQSSDIRPYNEAVEGFLAALDPARPGQGPKSVLQYSVERLVLDETGDAAVWRRIIRERNPAVVLAVGRRALEIVRDIDKLPVIYVMVPNGEQLLGDRPGATGVSMTVPPLISLEKLHTYFPHVRRLLVLYHRPTSDAFIAEATRAADLLHYRLLAIPVEAAEDVPRILGAMGQTAEALWMIPDPVVVNAQTVQAYLEYAERERVILLTFAEKYLNNGATFAVAADNRDMGRSAAMLARQVLDGKAIEELPARAPVALRILQNRDMLTRIAALNGNENPDP